MVLIFWVHALSCKRLLPQSLVSFFKALKIIDIAFLESKISSVENLQVVSCASELHAAHPAAHPMAELLAFYQFPLRFDDLLVLVVEMPILSSVSMSKHEGIKSLLCWY